MFTEPVQNAVPTFQQRYFNIKNFQSTYTAFNFVTFRTRLFLSLKNKESNRSITFKKKQYLSHIGEAKESKLYGKFILFVSTERKLQGVSSWFTRVWRVGLHGKSSIGLYTLYYY